MARRPSISVVLLRPLAAALGASPSALSAFLAAADLTPQMLADAEARVTPAQFCVAWAQALRLSGDAALALRLTEATPPGAFGIVEYVCRCAPTLGAALRAWSRYLGILDDAVEVGLVEAGPRLALRVIVESEAPAPASHELCFALVVRNARLLLGEAFRVEAVRFRHPAGAALAARHCAFFGCDVRFGASETEVVFDRAVLDAPLPTADSNLSAILVSAAEEKLPTGPRPLPLTEQVRRVLAAALSDDAAQVDAVARRLGLTARSLQRRLRDEGTSFNATRAAMRQELAERYLRDGLSCAEISFMLGFSEPSAFFRAFKRWTGLTPLERRERLAAGLAG
ncbi:MAG: AraC family transcriptional regulator [Myxococcales bacterium]